jgi:hypothetical protein
MKKIAFCMALLLLCSCIPVEDFGAYWDKGMIDAALIGKWDEMPAETAAKDNGKKLGAVQVADNGGTYRIDSLDKEECRKKDYAPLAARTLKTAGYTFLMALDEGADKKAQPSGDLIRYKIEGDLFRQYSLNAGKMDARLKEKYPGAKNIGLPPCAGKCLLNDLRILTLDDETFKILSEVPDTPDFWTLDGTYRKRPDLRK